MAGQISKVTYENDNAVPADYTLYGCIHIVINDRSGHSQMVCVGKSVLEEFMELSFYTNPTLILTGENALVTQGYAGSPVLTVCSAYPDSGALTRVNSAKKLYFYNKSW